jgi:hypothetical protein
MQINMTKSNMYMNVIPEEVLVQLDEINPYVHKGIDEGFKYLVFKLKPNSIPLNNGFGLKKNQVRLMLWYDRWLSRGGRLVLFKYVLSSIQFYWATIVKIMNGILTKIWKLFFHFLWSSRKYSSSIP